MKAAGEAEVERAKNAALGAMQAAGVGTWQWELPGGDFALSDQAATLLETAAPHASYQECTLLFTPIREHPSIMPCCS